MSDRHHWDHIYRRAAPEDLGWYEPIPSTLALVTTHSTPADAVIDVGGGESGLTEALLDLGYVDLTVLDLSDVALERSRSRLGPRADRVTWIRGDVIDFAADRTWRLWHDRATFHFLTTSAERAAYRRAAARALVPGGILVIAAFADDGPDRCAGLPVERYDERTLPAALAPDFAPIACSRLPRPEHRVGDRRPYVAAVLRSVG